MENTDAQFEPKPEAPHETGGDASPQDKQEIRESLEKEGIQVVDQL